MELAGFSAKYGYKCDFEPSLPTGKKGDLIVHTPSEDLFFETLSIGTSDVQRSANI